MDITNIAPQIFETVSSAGVHDWLVVNTLTNKELMKRVKSTQVAGKCFAIDLQAVDPMGQ